MASSKRCPRTVNGIGRALQTRALRAFFSALVAAAMVVVPSLWTQPRAAAAADADAQRWTAYGYAIDAPRSMWPMLELLHRLHFDWQLASASQRATHLAWFDLPQGAYGQYLPGQNAVRLSTALQSESPELGTALLAHELTHVNDDANGRLTDVRGTACYDAETRAFTNEANFWIQVVGPDGKPNPSPLEAQENARMFAFVGNSDVADLVLRTTARYVKECGR